MFKFIGTIFAMLNAMAGILERKTTGMLIEAEQDFQALQKETKIDFAAMAKSEELLKRLRKGR